MKMKKIMSLILVLSLGLLVVGCSGITGDDSLSGDSGELALSISDAPVNNVKSVWVTLDKVEVHNVDTGSWETVNDFESDEYTNGEFKVDLLQLRFNEELLGQKKLPTGTYDQIRLIVAANEKGNSNGPNAGKSYVVYKDSANKDNDDIFIPSGTQTGLKIDHEFTIEEGAIKELLLDNDVSKIMHAAGNSGKIILRPTAIDIIDQVVSGDVEGRVLANFDANDDGNIDENDVITNYDVAVEAYNQDGNLVKSTVATIEDKDIDDDGEVEKEAGSFLLRGLEEGDYTIQAKVVDEEGNEVSGYKLKNSQPVTVVAEETKAVNTLKINEVTTTTN